MKVQSIYNGDVKVSERFDEIQLNMHEIINDQKERHPESKAKYNDYVVVFLTQKIAELELAVKELRETKFSIQ